ncbi:MAG: hypothetical protein AMXMBFR78_20860 [Rubrivivax sp.]
MSSISSGIGRFAQLIPAELLRESGKVFYSGRTAFSREAALYVLGVNPGGAPENYTAETVGAHTEAVLTRLPEGWSAYRDEVWEGSAPGTYGMAPRVLHLLRRLNLAPEAVPASNLIFVRSRREAGIKDRQSMLSDLCWPFHATVIAELRPRVVLCLGSTAGRYVRSRLGANQQIGEFVERNYRGWRSRAFAAPTGQRVVVATHPSIADWTAPSTDPSELVHAALHDASQETPSK